MDDLLKFDISRRTNAEKDRPLMGVTILMIEDSRYFSDAVRLMAIRSGGRLRRADCIASARKHIKIYKPDVMLVDIGLPDGSGLDMVAEVHATIEDLPIIAMSGDDRVREVALSKGASKFLIKPFFDLAQFQQTILSVLPRSSETKGFKPMVVGQNVEPDLSGLADDLLHIRQILFETMENADDRRAGYCAQFLNSVARTAGDELLTKKADQLAEALRKNGDWVNSCQTIVQQIETRLRA